MARVLVAVVFLLLTTAVYAQQPVTVIGPVTPGNCVQWFSTSQLKDPGITCNGGTSTSPGGSNLQVQYNNAGTFGGYTNTQLTALINAATASLSGALPAWPNNTTTFFRGDGTYAAIPATTFGGQSVSPGGSATVQGNGAKIQLSTGSTTTNDCVKFDANGNTIDSGAGCGTGGTTVSNVVTTYGADPTCTSDST